MVLLLFLPGEKTKSYRTNVREMCSSSTFIKIKGTIELAYFVLIFVMLTSSTSAAPNKGYSHIEDPNGHQAVLFHNCKEVDFEHLQYLMGDSFDSKRMAVDKKDIDHNSFKERSISNSIDDEFSDDVQYSNDMPYSNLNDDDFEDFIDDESVDNDIKTQNDEGSKPDQNSIKYMRRKRQTTNKYYNEDNEIDRIKKSRRKSDEKPQKKLFMDLKKFIRKSKKGKKVKKLPWTCQFETRWIRLDKDYFPPFIISGSCQSQKKCFYDLYDCIPKKYGVKILRRDPSRCNPIPALRNTTVYEEMWIKEQIDVKVACECGKVKGKKQRQAKSRTRP